MQQSAFPKKGSKAYTLLNSLLHGQRVNPAAAALYMNLSTLPARCAELRKLGWPVMTEAEPHIKLKGEKWTVYFFDTHFRGWIIDNPTKHPSEYPHSDGRGRFTKGASK